MDEWRVERACRCGCGEVFMPERRHHWYARTGDVSHRHQAKGKLMRLSPDEIKIINDYRRGAGRSLSAMPDVVTPNKDYAAGPVDTSKAAYLQIGEHRLTGLRRKVWDALVTFEPRGLTGDEISIVCSMLVQTQTARCAELRLAGLIFRTDRTRRTRAGRQAHVYRIAPEYRQGYTPRMEGT